MDACDVLIVGGGPAGSSCALALRDRGLDVLVLDRREFPRDKVCAGWVTPQVLAELGVEAEDYRKQRVIQPIRGFQISRIGNAEVEVEYDETVSYGIRRCEFDHYLLQRCGARLALGYGLRSLVRRNGRWIVNDAIAARTVVGAAGHFCPVARQLGADPGPNEPAVLAREIEFEMSPEQQRQCGARPELPQLFFASDLRGYGWVVRKGDWLNVGIGRQDPEALGRHVEAFLELMIERGRIPRDTPRNLRGHAYLLYDQAPRRLAAEGAVLVGDSAGLAYGRSGEGIRPAVESGLIAGQLLAESGGRFGEETARLYERRLQERFGARHGRIRPGPIDWLPERWRHPLSGRVLASPWFARHVVIDRWFLHRHSPPLELEGLASQAA